MARVARCVSQFWTAQRFGDELISAFSGPYTAAHLSVGFVKASGVRHIAEALTGFRQRGGTIQAVVGVDGKITTLTGVQALARFVNDVWLFRHPGRPLFHPKTFLFESDAAGLAIVGSANLTESALWVNYEDAVVLDFNLRRRADRVLFDDLKRSFADAVASPNAKKATSSVIKSLVDAGLLPGESEAARRSRKERSEENQGARTVGAPAVFPATSTPPPPVVAPLPEETQDRTENPPPRIRRRRGARPAVPGVPPPQRRTRNSVFVLRLGDRDVGRKPGYSPDVFIPLAAYRNDPAFWGVFTSTTGSGDPERRPLFQFNRLTGAVEVDRRRLYFYGARSEFRFSSSQVHADSALGDLMRIEIAPPGSSFEYMVEVIKPTHHLFAKHLGIAVNDVPNSDKRWGYV
jgi:HKD family nuclease